MSRLIPKIFKNNKISSCNNKSHIPLSLESLEPRLLLNATLAAASHPKDTFYYDWTRTFGSVDNDFGYGVTMDGQGNTYVTGEFQGAVYFDRLNYGDRLVSNGRTDIFITKFAPDGSYQNTFTIGGDDYDGGYAITTDSSDNILITGYFSGTVDFNPTSFIDKIISQGDRDIFITKILADGTYAWTRTIGGTDWDDGHDIITDSEDNVIITGLFNGSVDFDPTKNPHILSSHGRHDAFVTKLDAHGNYLWTKTFGGANNDSGYGLDIDNHDNIFVTGEFMDTVDFDPSMENEWRTAVDLTDIYVTKFQSNGNYGWTKTFGGEYYDNGQGVAVDDAGNIFITGHWGAVVDFDFTGEIDNHYSAGARDIFVTKINADTTYGWTASWGSNSNDISNAIGVDTDGNVYITGMFYKTVDFDPTDGIDEHTSSSAWQDIFVTKLTGNGNYGWTATFGSLEKDFGTDIFVDATDNILVTGIFRAIADFNPLGQSDYISSMGYGDVFLTRFSPNVAPAIGAFETQPNLVTRGENLTITAQNVSDSDGTVARVNFYYDSNYNETLEVDQDTLLFEDNSAQDGWTWTGSTHTFQTGINFFFAQALDYGGAVSNSVSATAELNEKPYVDALTINPDPVPLGQLITLEAHEVHDDQLDNIPLVEFYFDSNDNGILDPDQDAVLGADTNETDGWTWTGPTINFPIGSHFLFARVQDTHGVWSEPVDTNVTIESFQTQAGFPRNKTIKYTDLDGSDISIKFNHIIANLVFSGDYHDLVIAGNTTTILDNANLLYIQLLNSNPSSSISFNVKNGDGQTTLAGVTGGSLGKINGKNVKLIGDIDLSGSLGNLTLDDIDPDVSIVTGAPSPKGIKIKTDQIDAQVNFNLHDNVKNFQASTYHGGSFTADVINNFKVKNGPLDASVETNVGEIKQLSAYGNINGDVISATSINNLTSKTGGITQNVIISSQMGDIKKITTAQTIAGRIISEQSIDNINVKSGGFTGEAHAKENIGKIKAGDFQGALIAAGLNINQINAAGNIAASYF
ncbi:MAG: LEPR-XLL domain-containing protein, partial [Planctomycetes bacterium]|nr:LEPR-XLL domain-containing protein [Planctomycetota bacterium]